MLNDKALGTNETGGETIQFLVKVSVDDEGMPTTTVIECDTPNAGFAVMVAATEHFMTATALHSDAGFEKALDLLCEGARANQVTNFGGHPSQ